MSPWWEAGAAAGEWCHMSLATVCFSRDSGWWPSSSAGKNSDLTFMTVSADHEQVSLSSDRLLLSVVHPGLIPLAES